MTWITALGDRGLIWIAAALALLAIKKYRKYGICLILALMLDLIAVDVTLKPLIHRARPYELANIALLIRPPSDFSFPSGHTASSFAAAAALFAADRRFGFAGLILAAFIAFSRLYLYAHYPTDILGGVVVGIICGISALSIYETVEKRLKKKPDNKFRRFL